MIRDIPPLAVEGVDPWEKVQLDPATRRIAEHAAAAAGLSVEEWLERAVRRACPSAFRSASVTIPSTPILAPTFAAPPAPPRPVMAPPAAAAPPAQPPEIEASLAALLAMAQRQQTQPQQFQPQQPQPIQVPFEARYAAPVEPAPAPLPPFQPVIRQAAPVQHAPMQPAPMQFAPPAPQAEPPAALRRAPTIAERLARQRFDEDEQASEGFAAPAEQNDDRNWDEPDATPRMFGGDDQDEPRTREPKQRFKLWAKRDEDDIDEPEIAPRRVAPQPPSRKATRRLAIMGVGIALAVTAGAVAAQYLIPGRSHISAPSSANSTPSFSPTSSNPSPLPGFNNATNAPSSSLPGIPSLPPSPPSGLPSLSDSSSSLPPLPSLSSSPSYAPAPSSLPPVPGLPSLPSSSGANAPTDLASLPPAPPSVTPAPQPPLPLPTPQTAVAPAPVPAPAPLPPATNSVASAKPAPLGKGKVAPAATPAPTPVTTAAAPNGAKTAKIEPNDTAPTDPKALAPWLEQRAKNGDAIAQYRLGVLYSLGQGVQQDYQHAAQLFKTSAEGGVAEAQYNIAVMYGEGLGIGRDPVQAVQWYQKAAAQGNANAAFNLGVAYSNGVGVQQSMDQAAQWFRRAASAGIINAQFNLGLLYERGDGVPVSQVEAYAWYSAAAAHGDSGAAQRRDRLGSTLSPSTLKEAQARAQQVASTIQGTASNAGGGLATNASAPAGAKP